MMICVKLWMQFVTARKRSLLQGNVFTPVCHSVHSRGAILSRKVPSIVGRVVPSLTGGVLSLAGGAVLSKDVL